MNQHDTVPFLFIDFSAIAAEHGVTVRPARDGSICVDVDATHPGCTARAALELSAANNLCLRFAPGEVVPLRLCQVQECGEWLLIGVTFDHSRRGQWLVPSAAYRALSAIRRIRRPA